jgi:hypothetical protein
MGLALAIAPWKFRSPSGLQLPKWELIWECECSFFHTLLHSRKYKMCLSSLPLISHSCKPLPWSRTEGYGCDTNSLRNTKILSWCHPFYTPLHSPIWPCKGTKWMKLMESKIVVSKDGTYKILDTIWFINIDRDQNIRQKRIPLNIRSFLSLMVHLKEFGP